MESFNYLRRLAREARWRLPREEAEEVIADYTELLEGDSRSKNQLCQDLGTPRQAVRLLDEHDHAYRRWLVVFLGLTFCIGAPWVWLFDHEPLIGLSFLLMLTAVAVSLIWRHCSRQKEGVKKTPLPRGLRPLLAVQALAMLAVVACIRYVLWIMFTDISNPPQIGWTVNQVILLAGTFGFASGLFGLIHTRMADRRWCAAYLFGLTVVLFCMQILMGMGSMNLDSGTGTIWVWIAQRCSMVLAAGVLASGVALC